MAVYTREEVLAASQRLAEQLAQTEEIARFKQVEAKLNANEKVKQLIKDIKKLQKQAVNFQAYEKTEALKSTEAEIDELQAKIDDIPIVQEFKAEQGNVNDMLQLVSGAVTEKVTGDTNDSESKN